MPTIIEEPVEAMGSAAILIYFTDENGNGVVPKGAYWNLIDKKGNIINYRKNMPVSPLASTSRVVLSGLDLLPDTSLAIGKKQLRILRVNSVYDSITMGTDIPLVGELHFYVDNPVVIIGVAQSFSPSASRSPSASLSPSASVSPSVSPSASPSPSP
jgi:hypothetical protein